MYRIWEYFKTFNNFWQYKDLKEHMDTVKPLVKSWEEMLNNYRKDNEDSKLILRRFDEVLLEKASKFSVDTLEKSLKIYAEK